MENIIFAEFDTTSDDDDDIEKPTPKKKGGRIKSGHN